MRIIEKEGKTKDDVLEHIIQEIGEDKKDFIHHVEVVENNKTKFLLFNNKITQVKVTVLDEAEKRIIEFLKELLQYMNLGFHEIKINECQEGSLGLELDVEDVGILIGKRGKTLEAIQYLMNLIFNKNREQKLKIILDIKNYREKRIQSLQKLAKNIALFVKKTRQERILNPMNPYERKIVHSTLQDDKDVITESMGEGIYKQIKVRLRY